MEIRRRHGPDMTVIMISSNDQEQMVESCIREGADSYIIKPLRMSGAPPREHAATAVGRAVLRALRAGY